MRSALTMLAPEIKRATLAVNPETVLKKQKQMKKSVEQGSTRKHPGSQVEKGDWVRIKKPDGHFSEYQQVRDTGRTSLELTNGEKWPLAKASTRVRKNQRFQRKPPHEGI